MHVGRIERIAPTSFHGAGGQHHRIRVFVHGLCDPDDAQPRGRSPEVTQVEGLHMRNAILARTRFGDVEILASHRAGDNLPCRFAEYMRQPILRPNTLDDQFVFLYHHLSERFADHHIQFIGRNVLHALAALQQLFHNKHFRFLLFVFRRIHT